MNRGPCSPSRSLMAGFVVVLVPSATVLAQTAGETNPAGSSEQAVPQDVVPLNEIDMRDLSLEELLQVRIPEVTGVSKRSESVEAAPATVVVVTSQDIRVRGYSTLVDVLRDLPGMEVNEHYSCEFGALVPVRGVVGNNKIIVLIDGARTNPPGGEPMMFRSDFSVRQAERIEIIYGPGSTMYGQDAISAVINVVTKKPEAGQGVEAGIRGGYWPGGEAWTAYRGQLDKLRVAAYAQYLYSSLPRLSTLDSDRYAAYAARAGALGGEVDDARPEQSLNAALSLSLDDSRIEAWFRHFDSSSSDGLGPDYARAQDARWIDWSLVLHAANQAELGRILQLSSSLLLNRYQIDKQSRYVYPNDTNTGWYRGDNLYGFGTLISGEERLSGAVDISKDLQLNATLGVAAMFFDVMPRVSVPGGVSPNQDLAGQGGDIEYYIERDQAYSLVRRHRIAVVDYQTYSAYGEAEARLFDRVRLVAGLRVDYDTRTAEAPLCPRLALSTRIIPGLTAKYIYSQAYVAPPPYYSQTTWENSRALAIPNPDLDAERSSSHEISVIYQNNALFASLSAYYNSQHNLLIGADTLAGVNEAGIVWVGRPGSQESKLLVMSVNGGTSRAYGADLFAKLALWRLQGWGSYSYVDFRQDLNGTRTGLAMISRHNFRLGLSFRILRGLFATASLVARSTPEGFTDDVWLPSHKSQLIRPWDLNLHVLYELGRNVDLFLTGTNVANHRYALRGLYSEAFGNTSLKEGIRIWAGARFSFDTTKPQP